MSIISISFRCIVQPVRRGILQVQVQFPPSAQRGERENRGFMGGGGWEIRQKGNMGHI